MFVEDQVELAALGDAGDLAHRIDVLKAVERPRSAPARDMAAGSQQEQAEMSHAELAIVAGGTIVGDESE